MAKKTEKSIPTSSASDVRVPTGIYGVDELIGGGLLKNSITLVAGHCGTGKTTFATQFLYNGAKRGEPGLFVSLETEPNELARHMQQLNPDTDALLRERKIVIIKPDIQHFDKLKKRIEDEVDRMGAKRVVIGPFSFISEYFANVYDARKALADLRRDMIKFDCTALALSDIKEGEKTYSTTGFEEFVAHGVIVLDLVFKSDSNTFVRTIQIRKMENTSHSMKLVPIEITEDGIKAYPDAEVF